MILSLSISRTFSWAWELGGDAHADLWKGKMNQYMIIKNLLDSRHSYVLYIHTFIIHSATAVYEEPLLGAGHQCKLRQISYSDNAQIITKSSRLNVCLHSTHRKTEAQGLHRNGLRSQRWPVCEERCLEAHSDALPRLTLRAQIRGLDFATPELQCLSPEADPGWDQAGAKWKTAHQEVLQTFFTSCL